MADDPKIIITPTFSGMTRSRAVTHIAHGIDIEHIDIEEDEKSMSAATADDVRKQLDKATGWTFEEFQPYFSDGAAPEAAKRS